MGRAIFTWTCRAVLGFALPILLTACGARAAVQTATPRTTLRISLRDPQLLIAFRSLRGFSIQAAEAGDSEQRLKALQEGTIDVALVVADVTYMAFNGGMQNAPAPLQRIRGIALMDRAVVQFLVGPNVNPTRDLRGMRIGLGDPAAGNTGLGERLLNSMGVRTSEIHGELVPYALSVDRLLKGEVDASIVTGLVPFEPVARALRGGAHLRDIDESSLDGLRVQYPLLRRTLVPRGSYPFQDAPLHTVGVDRLLVCRADLDNNIVYEITRALFETVPENVRRQMDAQRAPATVIPLHAGAARYYRERELGR